LIAYVADFTWKRWVAPINDKIELRADNVKRALTWF